MADDSESRKNSMVDAEEVEEEETDERTFIFYHQKKSRNSQHYSHYFSPVVFAEPSMETLERIAEMAVACSKMDKNDPQRKTQQDIAELFGVGRSLVQKLYVRKLDGKPLRAPMGRPATKKKAPSVQEQVAQALSKKAVKDQLVTQKQRIFNSTRIVRFGKTAKGVQYYETDASAVIKETDRVVCDCLVMPCSCGSKCIVRVRKIIERHDEFRGWHEECKECNHIKMECICVGPDGQPLKKNEFLIANADGREMVVAHMPTPRQIQLKMLEDELAQAKLQNSSIQAHKEVLRLQSCIEKIEIFQWTRAEEESFAEQQSDDESEAEASEVEEEPNYFEERVYEESDDL